MSSRHMGKAEVPEALEGLRVEIDRVVYIPEAETPPDRPHAFAYFITIHNDSKEAVTIKGRKWIIENDFGEIIAVEGDGVVGKFPLLEPGETFSYNSYHINNTSLCWAEGSYLGITEGGRKVRAPIPKFKMIVPTNG